MLKSSCTMREIPGVRNRVCQWPRNKGYGVIAVDFHQSFSGPSTETSKCRCGAASLVLPLEPTRPIGSSLRNCLPSTSLAHSCPGARSNKQIFLWDRTGRRSGRPNCCRTVLRLCHRPRRSPWFHSVDVGPTITGVPAVAVDCCGGLIAAGVSAASSCGQNTKAKMPAAPNSAPPTKDNTCFKAGCMRRSALFVCH